jgi:hypothetical protein
MSGRHWTPLAATHQSPEREGGGGVNTGPHSASAVDARVRQNRARGENAAVPVPLHCCWLLVVGCWLLVVRVRSSHQLRAVQRALPVFGPGVSTISYFIFHVQCTMSPWGWSWSLEALELGAH